MLEVKVLVRKCLCSVDARRARSVAAKEVTPLAHEVWNLERKPVSDWSTFNTGARNGLTIRWKRLPLYPCGRPIESLDSPVQNCRKFSAVFGTTSLKSSKVMRPSGSPGCSNRS